MNLQRIILLLLAVSLFTCSKNGKEKDSKSAIKEKAEIRDSLLGVDVTNLRIDTITVARNQTFGAILQLYGHGNEVVEILRQANLDGFSPRNIRQGANFYAVVDTSTNKIQYLFYLQSVINYLKIDFTGPQPVADLITRPNEYVVQTKGAYIVGSLYQTLSDIGAPTEIAVKMASVYDWTIDFFAIKQGDYFKVVYEELLVEGEPKGLGKILAVHFYHKDKDFFGYLFEHDKKEFYYDEKGESLRKPFLKAPLNFSRISSKYTKKRYHPVQKRFKPHLGVDYAAPTGTPIRSIGNGTVEYAGYKGFNGNFIKIAHNKKQASGYLHLSKIAKGVKRGAKVAQGQIIGYVGSTGLSTGPHLCFRFWQNGEQINPLKLPGQPSIPLPKDKIADFNKEKDKYEPLLKGLNLEQATLADAS